MAVGAGLEVHLIVADAGHEREGEEVGRYVQRLRRGRDKRAFHALYVQSGALDGYDAIQGVAIGHDELQ